MEDDRRALFHKVALGCRILAKMGLVDYRGHLTARLDDAHFVIRGRGVHLGNLLHATPEEMIIMDLDGRVVEGDRVPPGEAPLHAEIYRKRPDVRAIAHTHQPLASAFGAVRRRILPMTAVTGPVAGREIPIYESSRLILTREQGEEVARVLGDHWACHLRHHGMAVAGRTIEEAVISSIWIEDQARMTLLASLLGRPEGIPPDEIPLQAAERDPSWTGRWAYYASLLEEPD